MDWDGKMAKYFESMIRSKQSEIYDVGCLDSNIPPINSDSYMNEEFTKSCIIDHLALNSIIQDQIRE